MAKQVDQRIIGVDVAKSWLDICDAEQGEATRIDNTGEGIEAWLRGLSGPAQIAVEATNRYHERFIEQADAQGFLKFPVGCPLTQSNLGNLIDHGRFHLTNGAVRIHGKAFAAKTEKKWDTRSPSFDDHTIVNTLSPLPKPPQHLQNKPCL